jgi:hypothetical protein
VRYLAVLAVSLLVGGAVYLATVRGAREVSALGFGDEEPADEGAAAAGRGYAYLRVSTDGPTVGERLQSLLGVIVLVAVGSVALAFSIYQVGHLINVTIESFLGS